MTRRTLLFALAALLVFGGLAVVAFRAPPVPVEVAVATRGPLEVTLDVDATARVREVFEVSAPIAGLALRSPLRVGDPVVAGETVVAVVEPAAPGLLDARSRLQAEAAIREAEAALAMAETGLVVAEEDLAYAERQFERAQTLVERGAASLVRLEDAAQARDVKAAARDAALSARDAANGALARARAALVGPGPQAADAACCMEIRAPTDGVVLDIDRLSARPVQAGERLLSLGDPADLEIVADILSSDAVRLPEAAPARVELWGGPGTLEARLRRVEPRARTEVSALGIEEQRVEAHFDLLAPPEARPGLGDGYAVRLRIRIDAAEAALRVPLGAVFRDGADWALFAVRDGRAELRRVEIGLRNDREAEILSGLEEGEAVVVHPGDRVAPGVRVSLP